MMNKLVFSLFILYQTFFTPLGASSIDFTQNAVPLLPESKYYVTTQNLSLEQIKAQGSFIPSKVDNINLGFVNKTLWIQLDFYNKMDQSLSKVLEVKNPLLGSVILYDGRAIIKKGLLYERGSKRNINTTFTLTLKPYESRTVYLAVKNTTTALRLGLDLKDQEIFLDDEQLQQAKIFLFFGILLMLFFYTTALLIYTKENAYLYYSFYLFALIAQQMTYLGISQIFLPYWLLYYDDLAVVLKVNLLYIAAAIFAKSFLQTNKYPLLDRIYNIIIVVAIIEMPLFGFPSFYYPEVAILTGFLFVLFNMFVGVYVYLKGYKQAKLFVIGWSFLVVGFTLMILDGLGLIAIMQKVPNLIMYLTALEAILLSLAFTDRYISLKEEKEKTDKLLLEALEQRQNVIENEISKQTKHLNAALENEQIILRELQHRTKNNLQLILSLTRMQLDSVDKKVQGHFKNLENRINAIAKTHEMLYLKNDLRYINMSEYLEELCSDLESLSKKELIFQVKARQVHMPLREASYVGLIFNELITNSIKYVNLSNIVFSIDLYKVNSLYILELKDNGHCYDYNDKKKQSMGLRLVNTLVKDQLDGEIKVKHKNGCMHTIVFRL